MAILNSFLYVYQVGYPICSPKHLRKNPLPPWCSWGFELITDPPQSNIVLYRYIPRCRWDVDTKFSGSPSVVNTPNMKKHYSYHQMGTEPEKVNMFHLLIFGSTITHPGLVIQHLTNFFWFVGSFFLCGLPHVTFRNFRLRRNAFFRLTHWMPGWCWRMKICLVDMVPSGPYW